MKHININIDKQKLIDKLGIKDGKDGVNGKDGKDGRTPKKGVNYFTIKEIEDINNSITKAIVDKLPQDIREEVETQIKKLDLLSEVKDLINDKKVKVEDVLGIAELIKESSQEVYVRILQSRNISSQSQRLQFQEDLELTNLQDGYVIKWDATKKMFVMGTSGGNNIYQSGTVTRTGGYISSVLNGAVTTTLTRTNNYITSFTNGTQTVEINRDANDYITSWSVV